MVSKVNSIGLSGLDGFAVEVETDMHRAANEGIEVVGLPDAAVKEARNRIKTALINSGFHLPDVYIMINLAPAHIKKEGSAYDLPMILGILAAAGKISEPSKGSAFIGEISLSGHMRPSVGILASVITARDLGFKEVYIPYDNLEEGNVIEGIQVYGVTDLNQLVTHLRGDEKIPAVQSSMDEIINNSVSHENDFSSVVGQYGAKRACEISAAGSHNLLFIGPPGAGKSMLAKCIPTIMPDMTFNEIIESSKIYSVAGKLSSEKPLIASRPFVKANQGISMPGLTGGGANPAPGLISLAHNGVLFLDEMPEFPQKILEALRQPMEDNNITISRVKRTTTYPASFMLVCAMNPCPCGKFGHPTLRCSCSPQMVRKYIGRISGPLLDRIDLQVELPPVQLSDINSAKPGESSESIKKRVNIARQKQIKRFSGTGITSNAKMSHSMLKECSINDDASKLLKTIFEKKSLSMRAYDKIIKLSQTIADLQDCDSITSEHVSEAVYFRSLDKKYWDS